MRIALNAMLKTGWMGTRVKLRKISQPIARLDQGNSSGDDDKWSDFGHILKTTNKQDLLTDWIYIERDNARITPMGISILTVEQNGTQWNSRLYSERNTRKAVTCSCGSGMRPSTKLLVVWLEKKKWWNINEETMRFCYR